MYPVTIWVDETDEFEDRFTEAQNSDGTITHTKVRGTVYVEGTPQDAAHFNNQEAGIFDAHSATLLLINALRQQGWRVEALEKATVQETGTVTLTNSQSFPFNNSIKTVPLSNVRDNLNYVVEIIKVEPAGGGNAGEIEVSERQTNGFKMAFTGSASSVVVTYAVIGGYDK
jgi:hypothetical protein